MKERVVILDFGSQFTQLISRRVRELGVYSEIIPFQKAPEYSFDMKAIILSGSPFSVRDEDAPKVDLSQYFGRLPVLAICYGAQFIAHQYGGKVEYSGTREYGKAHLHIQQADPLFKDIEEGSQVWMSHSDTITQLPPGYQLIGSTEDVKNAVYRKIDSNQAVYGVQFHPEVYHTIQGRQFLKNFLFDIAQCAGGWTPKSFAAESISNLRKQIGSEGVLLGLSGGVDSSVAAELLHQAIGQQLYCIFIDNGLLRKGEFEEVLASYQGLGLQVKGVRAAQRFYDALAGIADPELKRKVIGKTFVDVFVEEARQLENIQWLGQGTIYPDVIESVSVNGPSATIKSHHNVGGLPEKLHLKIVEPLRLLFKDEVRKVGAEIGVPDHILNRHPFPGPGLGIRILGPITPSKVAILQEADAIFMHHLKASGLYDQIWQAGTILLPVHTVGVMGDERTYEQVVALRAVVSTDGMTAEWADLPHSFLAKVSNQIINKVKGINRVVYDISTKPPAT
ncbi:MAG TPA: glutamine-hydrolyzing GMP synthase, partial [Saprospiraceae bacterium]|nr:glutamine-hydrolyzing GMP synthase [Saprospiraceae bacterium]